MNFLLSLFDAWASNHKIMLIWINSLENLEKQCQSCLLPNLLPVFPDLTRKLIHKINLEINRVSKELDKSFSELKSLLNSMQQLSAISNDLKVTEIVENYHNEYWTIFELIQLYRNGELKITDIKQRILNQTWIDFHLESDARQVLALKKE